MMTRRDAAAIVFLVALVAIVFGDALFFGRAFFFRDLTRFYFPSKKIVAEIIRSGEFPSWNPFWAAGQPLAANPDYGVFYPLQWLTFLPDFERWFRWHIVLHVAIAAAGAYLLLRQWTARRESAIFGAIVFSLGGLTLSLINLLPFLYSIVWLPWIALAIERRRFAAAALLLGISILGGEPVTIAQMIILIAAFVAIRARSWRALILFAGAGVAAVQLLPAADLLRDTVRSRGFVFPLVGQWSTPAVRLVDLFIPQFSGPGAEHFRFYWGTADYGWLDPFYVGIYFGVIAISLALAGLSVRLPGWRAVSAAVAVSIVLALGAHTPVLKLLYEAKIFSSFRYPEKFLLLGLVPLMFFSAIAFDRALEGYARVWRRAIAIACAVTILCGALLAATFHRDYTSLFAGFWGIQVHPFAGAMAQLSRAVWIGALIRFAAAIVALMLLRKWPAITVAILVLDLGYQRVSIAETVSGDFFRTPPAALQQIARGARVFHQADWYSATFIARRYLDLPEMYWVLRNGVYPMFGASWNVRAAMNRDIDETFLRPAADFNFALSELRRRNVPRWFEPLMSMSAAGYRAMYLAFHRTSDPHGIDPIIFVPVRTNPLVYFADHIVPCRSRDEFIDLISRGAATPRVAFADLQPFVPADGRVIDIRQTSKSADADVESNGNGLLIVSITRHKYWRATIDGRDARLIPVNLQYQGLLVPAGRHKIRMQYRNPLFLAGGVVSLTTVLLLLVVLLREGHHVRKEIVEPPLELDARVN